MDPKALYQKGTDQDLDNRFEGYKKMRIFTGNAFSRALSNKEVDILIKLWRKEILTPMQLCNGDVLKLVVWFFSVKGLVIHKYQFL